MLKLALKDIISGVFGTFSWFHLAWQDIKQRYRRSILGPLWLTISTGIMVTAMGPLYAKLFGQEIGPYFQHLAVSLVVWMLVSNFIMESCTAFISAEGFIKDLKLPFTLHLLRVLGRNIIILGHNSLIIIIILTVYPPAKMNPLLIVPVAILLLIANLFWIGLILAIICTRFRDIPQIVNSLILIAFFVSPIVWKKDMLGRSKALADWNPLYHLVDVVRTPLLGSYPEELTWWALIGMIILEILIGLVLFSRFRSRIPYWV